MNTKFYFFKTVSSFNIIKMIMFLSLKYAFKTLLFSDVM